MLPRLLITLGDVAGIGPEIAVKAWPGLVSMCGPVVVGDPGWLTRAVRLVGSSATVQTVESVDEARPTADVIPCLRIATAPLDRVPIGKITLEGGQAAYDFLCRAIDLAMAGEADGIVTCPLHKEGLHAAGVKHPGHTEILAERTGTREFAMVLWGDGIAVAHVTLHIALRDVFAGLTTPAVLE